MNERIKELAEQADKWFEEDGHSYSRSAWNEKFAELIVRECMSAVGDGPLERVAIQRIKAAFGVEYYEPIEKAFGVEE